MREKLTPCLCAALLAVGGGAVLVGAEEPPPESPISVPPPVITAEADAALKRMGRFLQAAKSLAFEADVAYDVLGGDGQKIQYGTHVKAAWQPGKKLHVQVVGDELANRIYVDDGKLVYVDDRARVYAKDQVSEDLDLALDDLLTRLGLNIPLTDFFYADPYATLIESAYWGREVGVHLVRGVPCTHLAFVAEGLDWQIWIEQGDRPLPRKLVIDYSDMPGSPMYSAVLTSWEIEPRLAKDFAEFSPSKSEHEVEFLVDEAGSEGQQ